MKFRESPTFRSILPALTAIVMTMLLAASFAGSTWTAQLLGSNAAMTAAFDA